MKSSGILFQRCLYIVVLVLFGAAASLRCVDDSLGLESRGIIPDSSFKASSFDSSKPPYNARFESDSDGWSPANDIEPGDYLQVDLQWDYILCAIATQGARNDSVGFVRTYKIMLSRDNVVWTAYSENGKEKVFSGNVGAKTAKKNAFNNNPQARYIRVIPIDYHIRKSLRVGLFGYARFEVCISNPLGMQSGAIKDDHLTASSSQQSIKNARLMSASSWCPVSRDLSPYLQVDLGSEHVICAVAMQGNNATDQWVTSYHIIMSLDGRSWSSYQERNKTRIFLGNSDQWTIARQVLYQSPITKYMRIIPKTSHNAPCLRLEVYGYKLQPVCSQHSTGIPSSLIVPNLRITSTSYLNSSSPLYKPFMGRLEAPSAWITATKKYNDYLQVDLGHVFYIGAILTQGCGYPMNYWVTSYTVRYSLDNKAWNTYSEFQGIVKVFTGNTNRGDIVTNSVKYPFKAKFVRVYPRTTKGWKAMRIELKGNKQACSSPLGLESKEILDSQMTSSTTSDNTHSAHRGRLYGSSSWCSYTSLNTEYLQIDLGRVMTVTGLATQGDPSQPKWVTSFQVSYSLDDRDWVDLLGNVDKIFNGNTNQNDVIVHWLRQPIGARYIQIRPQESNGGHCLRLELFGCDFFTRPTASISPSSVILPSIRGRSEMLTCMATGEPNPYIQWYRNGTKMIGENQLTLQVPYTSANDVFSTFDCARQTTGSRRVVCGTNYMCKVMYPVHDAYVTVLVNLNVPAAPAYLALRNSTSLRLYWNPFDMLSDDVGKITWYIVEFTNKTTVKTFSVPHPSAFLDLTYLAPSTEYPVRMRVVSSIGKGMWTTWQNIQTSAVDHDFESRSQISNGSSLLPVVVTLSVTLIAALILIGFLLYKQQRSNNSGKKESHVTGSKLVNTRKRGDLPEVPTVKGRSASYVELQKVTDNELYQTIPDTGDELCKKSSNEDYDAFPEPTVLTGDNKMDESLLRRTGIEQNHVGQYYNIASG